MNFDRLEHFVRIAEAGTMSAAARLVHLTQPALSRSLKMLEEDLGTPLFLRQGRGLVLTAAGRALLPRARALLADTEALTRDVSRVAERAYFDVRIGTVDSVATYLLPRVVGPLLEELPGLHIKLFTARTVKLLAQIRSGELDIALVAWSGAPPEVDSERIGPYGLRFYGRADRFPALADARTDDDVRRFPLVEIEPQPGQPTMIPEDAPSFAVANSLASVKALVLAGFGVGALLDFMLSPPEAALLVSADVAHDPDCGLFLATSPTLEGAARVRVAPALARSLRGVPGLTPAPTPSDNRSPTQSTGDRSPARPVPGGTP